MINMKTKIELEAITCQISKDLSKYELEFHEMVTVLCWIMSTIGQRFRTLQIASINGEIPPMDAPEEEWQKFYAKQGLKEEDK
jgi:hypothetical protein